MDELEVDGLAGALLVTTLSGSRYRLDFDAHTATRFPNSNDDEDEDEDDDDDDDDAVIRRDLEERPLLALLRPVIGWPLVPFSTFAATVSRLVARPTWSRPSNGSDDKKFE